MKLAFKIFFAAYFTVLVSVGAGGFMLTKSTTNSLMRARTESTLSANEYAGKLFLALAEESAPETVRKNGLQSKVASMVNTGKSTLKIGELQKTTDYSDDCFAAKLKDAQQGYREINYKKKPYLQAILRVDFNERAYYVETLSPLEDVYLQNGKLMRLYRIAVLGISLCAGGLLMIFSLNLARPFKKVIRAANSIAYGNYKDRIDIQKRGMGCEELDHLCRDFNYMADAVEKNNERLQAEVEKREIFIGDFSHELKTPMTSIIGYADLLRSYNLDEEERRNAANAIYSEGKRLEDLSMKLLDIIVMDQGEIELTKTDAQSLSETLKSSLRFLPQKYGLEFSVFFEDGTFLADESLLLSLLYNLADNAAKASEASSRIEIVGTKLADGYCICVEDHGRGIEQKNIEKITEPFFMEDKSRARKLGGAGLGLALCCRIAKIHGTKLQFHSQLGVGTTVSVTLKNDNALKKEGEAE